MLHNKTIKRLCLETSQSRTEYITYGFATIVSYTIQEGEANECDRNHKSLHELQIFAIVRLKKAWKFIESGCSNMHVARI